VSFLFNFLKFKKDTKVKKNQSQSHDYKQTTFTAKIKKNHNDDSKKSFASFVGTHTSDCYTAVANTDVVSPPLARRLLVAENQHASMMIINISKTKQHNKEH